METKLLLSLMSSVVGAFIGLWLVNLNWGKPKELINRYLEYRSLRKTWISCPLLGKCQYCVQPKEFKGASYCRLTGNEIGTECPRWRI